MARDPNQQALRLRKKHSPGGHARPDAADGARIAATQSIRSATTAGLIAIIAFTALWPMLTVATGRVFPWLTILLGFAVGFAVRRGGMGFDWRFPTLAAVLAFTGSILANIVVAATNTARALDTDTLTVLKNVTTWTWPIFFEEVMTAADFVFALTSAGIAAFYASRRISRREYQAIRIWRETQKHGHSDKT